MSVQTADRILTIVDIISLEIGGNYPRTDAAEIVAALKAAGYAIVPREPTEAMLTAYHGALKGYIESLNPDWVRQHGGRFGYQVKNGTKALIRYKAMIAAAEGLGS